MFLIGSSGTGKTLALVNALKTKVAFYKRQKKQIKILLLAHRFSEEWAKDMKSDKYGLQSIIKEYQCEPMKLEDAEQLFKGKTFCQIILCQNLDFQTHSLQNMVLFMNGITCLKQSTVWSKQSKRKMRKKTMTANGFFSLMSSLP